MSSATVAIPVNKSKNIFKCADRSSPGNEPRDITAYKELYLPFDTSLKATHLRKNPFGAVIYRNVVKAGTVYRSFDGKRLVLEVGCDTIIYIHINASQPQCHHRLFIQSESAFSEDTTIRRDAADIVKNTRHVETIVKFETYFLIGVLSTTSISAWLMVTGADVTYLYASKKATSDASRQLANNLLAELAEIGTYAPTLHNNIWALIIAEGKNNAALAGKQLPATIVEDEKVQAQVAGIIFGKWAMPNGNPFSAWTLISVLLSQAAVKSVTKYGDAYLKALNQRYKPIVDEMRSVNPMQPATLQKPALSLIKLMQESGVTVTYEESVKILLEVSRNKEKSYKNLVAITKAIDEFQRLVSS
jgi:hypothetical protein